MKTLMFFSDFSMRDDAIFGQKRRFEGLGRESSLRFTFTSLHHIYGDAW